MIGLFPLRKLLSATWADLPRFPDIKALVQSHPKRIEVEEEMSPGEVVDWSLS